jgi:hypothetical protein
MADAVWNPILFLIIKEGCIKAYPICQSERSRRLFRGQNQVSTPLNLTNLLLIQPCFFMQYQIKALRMKPLS